MEAGIAKTTETGAMTKLSKILLLASLILFAASLTGAAWGLFLPLGVVCLGLSLISLLLAKESTLFDREQALRSALTPEKSSTVDATRSPLPAGRKAAFGATASFR
jgi:hypothetical protein